MAWSFVIAGEAALVRLTFVDLIRKYMKERRVGCTPSWG
jgi:hypothetical protein